MLFGQERSLFVERLVHGASTAVGACGGGGRRCSMCILAAMRLHPIQTRTSAEGVVRRREGPDGANVDVEFDKSFGFTLRASSSI